MANITLGVSTEMKKEMEKFPEINWSEVARKAIKEKLELLEKFEQFTSQSSITEKLAVNLGRQLKKKVAARR